MSLATSITPSGVGIKFQSHRPRGYWLRENATPADLVSDEGWGERVASVTQILGVLDKPALPWWGMKIGVDGVLHLLSDGVLALQKSEDGKSFDIVVGNPEVEPATVERVVSLLTRHKLTVNHVRDKAGDRGLLAHSAFETWCATGVLPAPEAFPEDQRGYINGMCRFFIENQIEKPETEVMVGSITHQFAGRYDLRCVLNDEPVLLDLKTSKGVYPTHMLQLEAYEGASVECGYPATAARKVVHVRADGEYSIVDSEASYEDFVSVLAVYRALKRLEKK